MSSEGKAGCESPSDRPTLFDSEVQGDSRYGRPVIIKASHRDAATLAELNQLLRDSYAIVRHWRHPHILQPLDCFETGGRVHLVHPALRDAQPLSLDHLRESGTFILASLFGAVEFVHQMGYVHCDLKAENILVVSRGGRLWPYVTDFDFATPIGTLPNARIFGSPLHIAPEILRDEIVLPQSDFYSLGAMLLLLCHRDRQVALDQLGKMASGKREQVALEETDLAAGVNEYAPMLRSLLSPLHSQRPTSLGQELAAIIGGDIVARYERELLWNLTRTRFAQHSQRSGDGELLSSFVRQTALIFGIPEELMKAADDLRRLKPVAAYRIARSQLRSSEVTRVARYWQVSLDFVRAGQLLKDLERATTGSVDAESGEPQGWLRSALRERARRRHLHAAVLFEAAINHPGLLTASQLAAAKLKLAATLRALRYASEANRLIREVNAQYELPLQKRVTVLVAIADQFDFSTELGERLRILRQAYNLARRGGMTFRRFRIAEKQLFLLSHRGRTAAALKRCKALLRFAEKVRCTGGVNYMANALGCFLNETGKVNEARDVLVAARERLAREADLLKIPMGINIMNSDTFLGNYSQVIELGHKVSNELAGIFDQGPVIYLEENALHAHIMLGNFDEAEGCLARYRANALMRADRGGVTHSFILAGWLALRRGQISMAQVQLENARRLLRNASGVRFAATVLYYLGTIYLMNGNTGVARDFAVEIERLTAGGGHQVFRIDGRLLEILATCEDSEAKRAAQLGSLARQAAALDYLMPACLAVSHVLAGHTLGEIPQVLAEQSRLRSYIRESGGLLAKAVLAHLRARGIEALPAAGTQLDELKLALGYYRRGGFLIQAYNVCRELAEYYDRNSRHISRLRFLEEAKRIAEQMNNDSLVTECEVEITDVRAAYASKSAADLLLEVSEIFRSISDYRLVVQQLLNLALSETGAERGAILLAIEGGTNLRVEAVRDLDDASIKDVITVSRTVMQRAFERREPVFVDDAYADQRTSSLPSVLAHNILSIACVPLVSADRVAGVLYLDHHSVPGIFHEEERRFIEAISNLVGSALVHARAVRAAQAEQNEYVLSDKSRGKGTLLITRNAEMQSLFNGLPLVARSNASVLLLGETGTGKEVIARLIHQQSNYREGPFISVNCANLSGDLTDSILFGIDKGAASGVTGHEGKLEAADGGTLFLDEVAELPLETQAKLLRAIENKEFTRVRSNRTISVDVRIIAATNQVLETVIKQGRFRHDLHHRISTLSINLIPLRERPEDIPILTSHFFELLAPGQDFQLSPQAMKVFLNYDWPGNIRELRRTIERIVALLDPGTVRPDDLKQRVGGVTIWQGKIESVPVAESFRARRGRAEREELLAMLEKHNYNQSAAARELGLAISTFQRLLKKHGIDPSRPPLSKEQVLKALKSCRGRFREAARLLRIQVAILKKLMNEFGIDPTDIS